MSSTPGTTSISAKPLRLWPGVVLAILQLVLLFGVPLVVPDGQMWGLLGAVAGGALILLWWLLFSRAPWTERLGAIALMVAAVMALKFVVDPSIAGAGMGRMVYFLPMPVLAFVLVAAMVISRRASNGARRGSIAAAIVIGCGLFTLMRTDGVHGGGTMDFHWRWTPTAEDRLLAQAAHEPDPIPPAPSAVQGPPSPVVPEKPATVVPVAAAVTEPTTPAEWPGFRGPERDGIVRGVHIGTDWATSPPKELWRQPIGPGWSSFAVQGNLIYTQEQRGNAELVSCYSRATGKVVWRHSDPVRFYESNGGAGPRATPTLSNGRVYTFGATGIVNALDARTGASIWSRNASVEANVKVPMWAFASSPLVIGDAVIVAVAGRLIAFDAADGHRRWLGPVHGGSYSSPHLTTIGGTPQVLLLSSFGVTSVAPADGSVLWEYAWEGGSIVQPAITADGDVLVNSISMMGGVGIRRLAVSHAAGAWKVDEKWTSTGLKPYFNDFVVHNGHAYGFDGSILSCIDLADGKRLWKGGRYGAGQLVLLPDQDVLLVLSEDGELALVSATPDKFTEIAHVSALNSKTWNHPVLVGDTLLIRNGEEMVAFRLALAGR